MDRQEAVQFLCLQVFMRSTVVPYREAMSLAYDLAEAMKALGVTPDEVAEAMTRNRELVTE